MGPPTPIVRRGPSIRCDPSNLRVMAIMVGIISPFILSFVLLHSDEICRQPADRTVFDTSSISRHSRPTGASPPPLTPSTAGSAILRGDSQPTSTPNSETPAAAAVAAAGSAGQILAGPPIFSYLSDAARRQTHDTHPPVISCCRKFPCWIPHLSHTRCHRHPSRPVYYAVEISLAAGTDGVANGRPPRLLSPRVSPSTTDPAPGVLHEHNRLSVDPSPAVVSVSCPVFGGPLSLSCQAEQRYCRRWDSSRKKIKQNKPGAHQRMVIAGR